MWTTPCFLCTSYGRADLPQHCQNTSAAGALMASTLGLSQRRPGETPRPCCFSAAPSDPFSLPGSRRIAEGSLTQYPPPPPFSLMWGKNDDVHYALSVAAFGRMDQNNREDNVKKFLEKSPLVYLEHEWSWALKLQPLLSNEKINILGVWPDDLMVLKRSSQ